MHNTNPPCILVAVRPVLLLLHGVLQDARHSVAERYWSVISHWPVSKGLYDQLYQHTSAEAAADHYQCAVLIPGLDYHIYMCAHALLNSWLEVNPSRTWT